MAKSTKIRESRKVMKYCNESFVKFKERINNENIDFFGVFCQAFKTGINYQKSLFKKDNEMASIPYHKYVALNARYRSRFDHIRNVINKRNEKIELLEYKLDTYVRFIEESYAANRIKKEELIERFKNKSEIRKRLGL